ncbi:MAG: tRNA dihydrouridine synthase DusB [Geminicoccaceae bacterium]
MPRTADLFIEGLGHLPPVLSAPLSGVSDLPFRRMVRRYFSGLVFSEMIAGKEMLQGTEQSLRMALFADDEPLPAVQLAGRDPAIMAEAARLCAGLGARLIDINFGCPVKKVVNGLGGAAIMRDERLAASIVEAVVAAVDVPVSVKMRLGWDRSSMNAPVIAQLAEAAGAVMVTVHGRTRDQFYDGEADWSLVADVRDAISLPLVINGDIDTATDARRAKLLSGADAVMIGRAAFGRPWHVGALAEALASGGEVEPVESSVELERLLDHHDLMLSFYGPVRGRRIARKHLLRALERHAGGANEGRRMANIEDSGEVRAALRAFYDVLSRSRQSRAA